MSVEHISVRRFNANAKHLDLYITSWNPGDGRRFKVFQYEWKRDAESVRPDYFDGGHLFMTMKPAEVDAFITGYKAGIQAVLS